MIDKFLDKAPRFLLYGLIFLMPVFFLPPDVYSFSFSKHILLASVVLLAALFWTIDILRRGSVTFRSHILFLPLFAFILFYAVSAYASGSFFHSFWGANWEADSFFNLLLLAGFFVISTSIFRERAYMFNALFFFIAGAFLSALAFFVYVLLPYFGPWEFTQKMFSAGFGSFYALALYIGGGFLLIVSFLSYANVEKVEKTVTWFKPKALWGFILAVFFARLFLIDTNITWIGLAASIPLLAYLVSRKLKPEKAAPMVLPLFVFSIVFILVFINLPFRGFINIPSEVRLGYGPTLDIAKNTLGESTKNLLLGAGPGAFSNQYDLHKSSSVNNTAFWNVSFLSGKGAFNFLATGGALGAGAIFLFLALFIGLGVRDLFYFSRKRKGKRKGAEVGWPSMFVFVCGLYFAISWMLYEINLLLLFGGFLMISLWVALSGNQKEIHFIKTPQGTFWGMTAGVLVFIFLIFGTYNISKNFYAETVYAKGAAFLEKRNFSRALPQLRDAASYRGFDRYWRGFSLAARMRASEIFKEEGASGKNLEELLVESDVAGKKAAAVNPNNSANFVQLADFYTTILPISEAGARLALLNYDKAASLSPQNPMIPFKKAQAHFAISKRLKKEMNSLANQLASLRAGADGDETVDSEEGLDEQKIADLENKIRILNSQYNSALSEALKEAEGALELKKNFQAAQDFITMIK